MDDATETLEDAAVDEDVAADEVSDDDVMVEDDDFVRSLQRKRLISPLTKALVLVLVAVTGFAAGAWVDDGGDTASAGLPAGFSPPAGVGAGRGTGATGSTTDGTVFGTVKLVDGVNVYIEDQSGTVTKVITDGSTTVRVSQTGTVNDLKPSDTVVVQGSTGDDGTMHASSISTGGGGDLGGGGAGPPGGFGGGESPAQGSGGGASTGG